MGVLDTANWEWLLEPEENWHPRVDLASGPEVVFYTYSALGGETVTRHADNYQPNTHEFEEHPTIIAVGGAGFVF